MEHKCPYCGSDCVVSCDQFYTNDTIEVYMGCEDCGKTYYEIYEFVDNKKEEEM